jgi:predicted secreted protein
MTWTSSIVLFILIWWMVFFAVLPWGIRRAGEEDKGHDAGAPLKPRLWLKAGVTTAISAVLFGAAFWLVQSNYVSFR